jgi:hypothetical protein
MISTLLALSLVLAIAWWVSIMYVWWKKEQGTEQMPATIVAAEYAAVGARLSRRGWYAFMLQVRALGNWGNKKFQKIFFSLFPDAEPAFAKHDQLAGLKHGPTSYFLRSISEKETTASKRTTKKAFS